MGCAAPGAAFLITISRMSCAPPVTGPPANTSSPAARALSVAAFPCSRTIELLVSVQASVMPLCARTTTSSPDTDKIVPRSNASVRAPFLVSTVNWPYMPPRRRSRLSPCPLSALFSTAAWVEVEA